MMFKVQDQSVSYAELTREYGRTSLPYETAKWFRKIGKIIEWALGVFYFVFTVLSICLVVAGLTGSWLVGPLAFLLLVTVAGLVLLYCSPRILRNLYSKGKAPAGSIPAAEDDFDRNIGRMRFEDHDGLEVIVPDPGGFDAVVLLEDPAVRRLQSAVVGRYLKRPLRHYAVPEPSEDKIGERDVLSQTEASGDRHDEPPLLPETVETKKARGGYRPAKWMNLPLWRLTSDELRQVVDAAPIYVGLTDRSMRKKRIELAVIAIAELAREINALEQSQAENPDDANRKKLSALRSKHAARQRVVFSCDRFYNAADVGRTLSDAELAQFHELLPRHNPRKNDWINSLVYGGYPGVSDALEQTAISLGFLSNEPDK